METSTGWTHHYLRLLGLAEEPPSLNFLDKIIKAHIATFPFENASKLVGMENVINGNFPIASIEQFLSEYEQFGIGGTCFTLNWHLKNLLSALGYDCYLVMLSHQHMAIVVCFNNDYGKRMYVDCGGAAPILGTVPLSLKTSQVLSFGLEQVVIQHRISKSIYRYARYKNGTLREEPWYFNADEPCTLRDFLPIIRRSYEVNRPFMSAFRCYIWNENQNYYVSLRNNLLRFFHRGGAIETRYLASLDEIESVAEMIFGLRRPLVRKAFHVLSNLGVNALSDVSQSQT